MNAKEFIQKFGWNDARVCIPNCACPEDRWFMRHGDLVSDQDFDDLKRLIESYELVNEFFNLEALGFDKAIELAKKQIEELEDNETVEFWHRWDDDLSCTVVRMKQAIADVESCMEVSSESN